MVVKGQVVNRSVGELIEGTRKPDIFLDDFWDFLDE
jgi:hypothetical protein